MADFAKNGGQKKRRKARNKKVGTAIEGAAETGCYEQESIVQIGSPPSGQAVE